MKTVRGSARVLVFTLAVLFVLFFTQAATHTHENGQNEASCQVCQGAHVAPAPIASALTPYSLISFEPLRPNRVSIPPDLFIHDRPSRAPPSIAL